jgi:hypothetical protein
VKRLNPRDRAFGFTIFSIGRWKDRQLMSLIKYDQFFYGLILDVFETVAMESSEKWRNAGVEAAQVA